MKAVVSIQQDVFGGPHNQWLRILPGLQERGIEVLFVLPGEIPDARNRMEQAGAVVLPLDTARLTLRGGVGGAVGRIPEIRASARALADLIRDHDADVVVSCGLANVPASLAAHMAHKPLVWQLLSVFAPWYVRTGLGAGVAWGSDSIMTVGKRCRRAHPPLTLVPSRVVEFLPPVDLAEFTPRAAESGPQRHRLVVGTVGNFNPHKGHDILWNACARLWREGFDFEVKVYGRASPSYETSYDAARTAWQERLPPSWKERVSYQSPQGSVAPCLADLDIFVLPSRSEGIPTVLLEAMATGLPCVAFDIGGVSEVVASGDDGLIAGKPDPVNLGHALRLLLQDAQMRSRLGHAARIRAEQSFGVERCVLQHERALRLAARSPSTT